MRTLLALLASIPCFAADSAAMGDSAAIAEMVTRIAPEARVEAWGATRLIVTAPGREDLPAGLMAQRVTVDWKDSDLASVARLIQQVSGLNVIIHPGVADRPVTLKAADMSLGQVLKWVAELSKTKVGWESGAIYIAAELPRSAERTVIYDIADLVAVPQDFPGPELAYNADGSGFTVVPAR